MGIWQKESLLAWIARRGHTEVNSSQPWRGYLTKHSHSSYGRLSDWLEEAQLKCCQPTQIVSIKGDPKTPKSQPALPSLHPSPPSSLTSLSPWLEELTSGERELWELKHMANCCSAWMFLWAHVKKGEQLKKKEKIIAICTVCTLCMPHFQTLRRLSPQLSLITWRRLFLASQKLQTATGCLLLNVARWQQINYHKVSQ